METIAFFKSMIPIGTRVYNIHTNKIVLTTRKGADVRVIVTYEAGEL
jgi:hypothetical protein